MDITTIATIVAGGFTIASTVVAFFKGRGKRKAMANKTEIEQRVDLREHMVQEIKNAEKMAKMFNSAIPKKDIAVWKHNSVIQNLRAYALGNQYDWFDDDELSEEIQKFIADTKEINYKG